MRPRYPGTSDLVLSPDEEAHFEAAVEQADRDHPPTHFPVTYEGMHTRVYPLRKFPKVGMRFTHPEMGAGEIITVDARGPEDADQGMVTLRWFEPKRVAGLQEMLPPYVDEEGRTWVPLDGPASEFDFPTEEGGNIPPPDCVWPIGEWLLHCTVTS